MQLVLAMVLAARLSKLPHLAPRRQRTA